jgi:hypothetical protein
MIRGVMRKEVKLKKLLNLNVKVKMTTKEKKRMEKLVVMAMMTVASPVVEEME